MSRSLRTVLAVLFLLAASSLAASAQDKKDMARPHRFTVTKIDADKGAITVQYTDDAGKSREKTFDLTGDVRLLDETGRLAKIAVFESGDEVLLVESEGKLHEVRRAPTRAQARRISDTVRTLIERAEGNPECANDLQAIYDMLRKLDTGKNGKIDASALKAEADQVAHERVKEIFGRLDTNKDGKISKSEARGLVKEHFDAIDTNKDGSIDFDELLKAAKERHESANGAVQSTVQKRK
ncbi:MAG TPA: EF-hand domain-containing protein [Gemmataceae bacterium]|jgi:Ca2+-binding EF-hand superfamily protein|nr:EF-hand domain-containing protein [Gemmataceae bacterium]